MLSKIISSSLNRAAAKAPRTFANPIRHNFPTPQHIRRQFSTSPQSKLNFHPYRHHLTSDVPKSALLPSSTSPLHIPRKAFHSTAPQFIFQSGLGKGQVSRHRLGAVPEPKVAKVKDPLGIEAKQKRLEAQLEAIKTGKEYDPYQHLTPEQRIATQAHLAEMERLKGLHNWLEFMFGQSSTYFFVWFLLTIGSFGGAWYLYDQYMYHPDKPEKLLAQANPTLQKALDGVDEDSKFAMRKKLKMQTNAEEIAQSIAKYNTPDFIETIQKQTHGTVEGGLKDFQPPPAASWETRKPILMAYLSSGYSYPDYVGEGHFHIYHNGKDFIPDILKQVEKDNPGMTFTFQILSPFEMHQMINQSVYIPRTMKQLDIDAKNNTDSSMSQAALLALDAVSQAQQQLKVDPNAATKLMEKGNKKDE